MSDVRVMDTLAMNRNLDEFRHLDQQVRQAAETMAAKAAEKDLQETKKDVEETDRLVGDRSEGGPQGEQHAHAKKEREEKKEPPPEINEGHLLDLKA